MSSDEKRKAYAVALNVIDAIYSRAKWGEVKPQPSKGGSAADVREALNALLLVAPADCVNAFMRASGISRNGIDMGDLLALRAVMRKDLELDTLVYSDPNRTWLAAQGT